MRRWLIAIPVVACAVLALAPSALGAPASARASLDFTFRTNKVDAGRPASITYRARHLRAGTRVELQRQMGTARVWRSVKTLPTKATQAKAPANPIGKYTYRLAALLRGKTTATSSSRTLYDYGTVTYGALCQRGHHGETCPHGDRTVGTTIFAYTDKEDIYDDGRNAWHSILRYSATSCRSFRIQWTAQGGKTNTSGLELIQAATDVQASSTPGSTIGSFNGTFDHGPFDLRARNNKYEPFHLFVWLNGTANCYTPNGTS